MRFDRDKLFATRRLRASAWLTLLSLALVQLSLASHRFDHAATDLVDNCDVCVQLERLDDAASGHIPPDVAIAAAYESVPHSVDSVSELPRVYAYRPRAPPIS